MFSFCNLIFIVYLYSSFCTFTFYPFLSFRHLTVFSSHFFLFYRPLFFLFYSMASEDTVNQMVDGIDNLPKVRQRPMEQATEPSPFNAQDAAGKISPKQDFIAANYGSKLGVQTLTRYYFTFLIPKGVILSAPGNTRTFEAPTGSIALYKQALMAGLRFLVALFFRELLFCLGLALG